jgi:hypothetical protein
VKQVRILFTALLTFQSVCQFEERKKCSEKKKMLREGKGHELAMAFDVGERRNSSRPKKS